MHQRALAASALHPIACTALPPTLVLVILQDYCSNVKARPAFMLLVPVLVFCVLCTLGIVGVKLGADQYEAETRARAQSVAMDWVSRLLLLVKHGCCWSNIVAVWCILGPWGMLLV
jgi:hypothetical protein